eukprot:2988815-Pyramimonas_sp.AAC.1
MRGSRKRIRGLGEGLLPVVQLELQRAADLGDETNRTDGDALLPRPPLQGGWGGSWERGHRHRHVCWL